VEELTGIVTDSGAPARRSLRGARRAST
jgi:hypothetical protein